MSSPSPHLRHFGHAATTITCSPLNTPHIPEVAALRQVIEKYGERWRKSDPAACDRSSRLYRNMEVMEEQPNRTAMPNIIRQQPCHQMRLHTKFTIACYTMI